MITDKQYSVIKMIENNLNIKFDGKCKDDAKKFISQYIKGSKQAAFDFKKTMQHIELNEVEAESMKDYFSRGWYNMPH